MPQKKRSSSRNKKPTENDLINGNTHLLVDKKKHKTIDLIKLIPDYNPFVGAFDPDTKKPRFVFCTEMAQNAIDFFEQMLTLYEGVSLEDYTDEEVEEFAKDNYKIPFKLQLWQVAIVINIFGWYSLDGLTRMVNDQHRPVLRRRYREVLIYIPRKNGKTPFAAGLIDYIGFCDKERGPQIYCAASTREQAGLVFRHITNMIDARKELRSRCEIKKSYKKVELPASNGYISVLSSDAGGAHGQNVSAAVIDEVHAHKNRDLIDTLTTATGTRRQPLLIYTTTADFNRESICNEVYKRAKQIQEFDPEEGTGIDDPTFLPVIYEIKDGEDIADPEVQKRVNPNLGVSIQPDFIKNEVRKAKENLPYMNTVLRLYFNKRTTTDIAAINMNFWERCKWQYPIDNNNKACTSRRWRDDQFKWLKGEECYLGLDLSSETDLTALVAWFPERKIVLPFFWLPGDCAVRRQRNDNVPYIAWIKYKYIKKTKGNSVDQEEIMKKTLQLIRYFDVRGVGIDPHNASWAFNTLQSEAGTEVFQVPMTAANMTTPIKLVNGYIAEGNLKHGGNPVLSWNAQNLVVRELHDERVYPHKVASTDRIDGMVAFYVALAVWLSGDTSEHEVNKRGGKLFSALDD